VPKTHKLESLIDQLLAYDGTLVLLRSSAARLTKYAVEYRYPGLNATRGRTQTALKTMERVRVEVRRCLGLRPRP